MGMVAVHEVVEGISGHHDVDVLTELKQEM